VDGLWKHTCFEVFLRDPAGIGYAEFNFSPSTEYAGYGFTRYREGMSSQHCSKPEDGTKSYWALAHPQGKPDFHHVDSFALTLAPEKT
jgi:hypothetical protein